MAIEHKNEGQERIRAEFEEAIKQRNYANFYTLIKKYGVESTACLVKTLKVDLVEYIVEAMCLKCKDDDAIASLVDLARSCALGREDFEERLFKCSSGKQPREYADIVNRLSPHLEKLGEKTVGRPSFKMRVLEYFMREGVRPRRGRDAANGERAAVRLLVNDCSLLEPFSSPELARKFFDVSERFPGVSFVDAEHAQVNIAWWYRCADQIPDNQHIKIVVLVAAMLANHDNSDPEVMAYLSSLSEAQTDEFRARLFVGLSGEHHRASVQMANHLAPYLIKSDEKSEGPSLKMRFLEHMLTGGLIRAEGIVALTQDCSFLGAFSADAHADAFFEYLHTDTKFRSSFFRFGNLRYAQTNMEWLLTCLSQIPENRREESKIFFITEAMHHNHDKPDIVAYLGSLIEAYPNSSARLALMISDAFPGLDRSLENIVSSLSPEAKDAFSRFMIEVAVQQGRCDMVITLLSVHRPLLARTFLLHLLGEQPDAIPQQGQELVDVLNTRMEGTVEVTVNRESFIKIFVLFKLGQNVLKNDEGLMKDLREKFRAVFTSAVNEVESQLTSADLVPQHKLLILALFNIGREGRYLDAQGRIAGEPMMGKQTFLQWAVDQDLIEALLLAGADTTGVENYPLVKPLIAKHSSFDRLDEPERDESGAVKATTVVGALLNAMPMMGGAARLIATYAQPALPVGNFGLQDEAVQASLKGLQDYINHFGEEEKRDKKTQAELDKKTTSGVMVTQEERLALQARILSRAKEVQRFDLWALRAIINADGLRDIRKCVETYLVTHEDVDSKLKSILQALQGYTKHLTYGEVSAALEEDNAEPKAPNGEASGNMLDDPSMPPLEPDSDDDLGHLAALQFS